VTDTIVTPIFDTHRHLIYADRLRYPIAETVPVLAGRSFLNEDYAAAIDGTGITSTLFMETTAEAWREEFDLVHELAEQPESLISGIIAQCPPEDATAFQPWIEAHLDRGLCGIRRICHTEPDAFALQTAFVANVRLLSSYGLPFDLCFLGRQLSVARELAMLCPNTQMVLDHCGVPDIAGGEWESWKTSITALALLENVSCKISGVLAYRRPGQAATLNVVRPYIEHCIACFGWDRVVWGSDWPFCNQSTTVREWVAVSRELVRGEPEQNRRKLFNENARSLYRLKATR
jgi:predicted TIM-barrel fold metal-dependent hydrolase